MPNIYSPTPRDLAAIASPYSKRRFFIHIGKRLQDVDFTLQQAGEPVVFPPNVYTLGAVDSDSTSVVLSGAYTLATSGVICLRPGTNQAGWFKFNFRTDFTLSGLQFLYGNPEHGAYVPVSDFSPIPFQNVTADPVMREVDTNGYKTWETTIEGRFYNAHLMPPDRSVLIEEMITPYGGFGAWSPRVVMCHGFVRNWDLPEVDKDRELKWRATVVSLQTYLDQAPTPPQTFGVIDLAKGKSVTASPNLTTPEFEPDEWEGGIGTTNASNLTSEELGDPYISEITPTITPETPSSNPVEDFLVDIVYAKGPNGAPEDLQAIVLRLPPGSPYFNEDGITLRDSQGGYYLSTRQTTFVDNPYDGENGVTWSPIATGNYIPLPPITLTSNAPRLLLCRDRQIFEGWFQMSGNDEMQMVEWAELPGFGDDQFPARNILLRAAGDKIQIRKKQASVDERVRDMVSWGDNTDYWENASDSDNSEGQWDDPNNAPAMDAGMALRRKPTCLDTNTADDWELDPYFVPTDDHSETDSVFVAVALGEFTVLTAEAMTAISPANGESLLLDDATWLHDCGEVQIGGGGGERVFYHWRDDTTLYDIVRGASGTTPAIHAIGASIAQINRHARLKVAITATVPGPGQALQLDFGQYLRQATTTDIQTVTIENEDITYRFREHRFATVVARGANATTPASHPAGYLVKQYDSRGAHRTPLLSKIQIRRAPVQYYNRYDIWDYVAPSHWEWWQSIEEEPRYPEEDPDWENDWIGEQPRLTYHAHPVTTPLVQELDMHYPENLAHVLINVRRMSDEGYAGRTGRVKMNLVSVPRYHTAAVPSHPGNEGAGGPLLAMLARHIDINMVTIEPGTFANTSANISFPESTVGNILREYIKRYGIIVDEDRDGRLRIYKDPFYPGSPIPPVSFILTAGMRHDLYQTNYPSRLAVGQVQVKITNPETDTVYEGRYPPMQGYGGVESYDIISTVANASMAATIAQGLYRRHPSISRTFEFLTVGPAPWLRPYMRIVVEDISDGLRRRPVLVDCMITSVTHNDSPTGSERITCREIRFI